MPLVMSPRAKRFMNMPALATGFAQRVEKYEQGAADAATQMSRDMSRRFSSNRPLAPARPGRPTTGGTFANFLQWQRGANGMIEFDLATLESAAPYWLILEIGTGQSAQILNPSGTASVQSQRGRHIPWGLYWGDGPGAGPTRRMSGKKRLASGVGAQQLYVVSSLPKGAQRPGSAGIIRREIKGKHYIQDGGRTGFTLLRDQIVADAQRTFR